MTHQCACVESNWNSRQRVPFWTINFGAARLRELALNYGKWNWMSQRMICNGKVNVAVLYVAFIWLDMHVNKSELAKEAISTGIYSEHWLRHYL